MLIVYSHCSSLIRQNLAATKPLHPIIFPFARFPLTTPPSPHSFTHLGRQDYVEMGISNISSTPLSPPGLLCEEDESCFSLQNDRDENLCRISESDDEFMRKLIDKELDYFLPIRSPYFEQRLLRKARLEAVDWILNITTSFGFQFKTAYLSLLYFDRYLSKRFIFESKDYLEYADRGKCRLLSVACLSLAAKMEECRIPALSEYIGIYRVEYNFLAGEIQEMELLVLKTLGWKMNLNTPFDYSYYFISKFCGESKTKLLIITRAIELTLATLKDINFVEYPSSMIAAAAILVASDCDLTRKSLEVKAGVIPSWGSQQREHLFSSYDLVLKIQEDKFITPNPKSDVLNLSFDCVESCQTLAYEVGHKRRLVKMDTDQYREMKIHKP